MATKADSAGTSQRENAGNTVHPSVKPENLTRRAAHAIDLGASVASTPLTFLSFVVPFCVYVYTAYPYVSGGDTGELVVTSCNVGVAHPPGYPTFSMLSAVFVRLLSIGSASWKVNVMNALLGATASLFVFKAASRLSRNVWGGVIAASLFAFSPTVWLYSIQGEVFPLNNALTAVITWLIVKFCDRSTSSVESERIRSVPVAYLGALTFGIAFTNQHTSVLFAVPSALGILYILGRESLLSTKRVLLLVFCVLIGMLPYVYLPWRALNRVMDSWGNQSTLAGFLHHFLRREYGTFQLAADQPENPGMIVRLAVYWSVLLEEMLYVTPFLAMYGWSCAVGTSSNGKGRRVHSVLMANYLFYMFVFHYLANLDPSNPLFLGVQARFWQQVNMYVCLYAGVGVSFIPAVLGAASTVFRRLGVPAIAVALAFTQLGTNFSSRDFHNEWSFKEYSESTLNALPGDSLVLLNGDLNNNCLKYSQQCENVRPDLALVSLQLLTWEWFVPTQAHNYPGVEFPGVKYHPREKGAFSMAEFLEANISKRRVFICGPFKSGDNSHEAKFETFPFGLCSEIRRRGSPPPGWPSGFVAKSLSALPSREGLGSFNPTRHTADSWEKVVFHDTWTRKVFLTSYASYHANQNLKDENLLEAAKEAFDDLFAVTDEVNTMEERHLLSVSMYRDAGVIYGQHSALMNKRGNKIEAGVSERRMLSFWKTFVKRTGDKDIGRLASDNFNPYIGRKVEF